MITLQDIANRANVSLKTASNVLNRDWQPRRQDAIKRATRVRRIAAELGYRPNTAARAMVQRSYKALGLIKTTDPSFGGLPTGVQWGIEQICQEGDYHLVFGQVPDQTITRVEQLPRILREWMVDGLIISFTNAPDVVIDAIERWGLKTVWFNVKRQYDAVRPDDFGSTEKITRQLIEMGHRRVAYLNLCARHDGQAHHYSAFDRQAGYRQAMDDAGLWANGLEQPPRPDPFDVTESVAWARQLLRQPDRPTALVAYSRTDAEWFMEAARLEGLSIPADLSAIGFSENAKTGYTSIRPATLELPLAEIGRQLARMLLQRIEHDAAPLPTRVIPVPIRYGHTVGPRGPRASSSTTGSIT